MENAEQRAAQAERSVEQIEQDWKDIESRFAFNRPQPLGQEARKSGKPPSDQEERLLEMLDVSEDVAVGYHADIGILLSALATARAERDALRQALDSRHPPESTLT